MRPKRLTKRQRAALVASIVIGLTVLAAWALTEAVCRL